MSSEVEDEVEDTKFEEVPFAILVEFFELVASAEPREISNRRKSNEPRNGTVPKFLGWIEGLFQPLPPRTGSILFRLLFPEQDIRRKYNLQETKLGQHLAHVLKVANQKQAEGLLRWNQTTVNQNGVNVGKDGCLGLEVSKILRKTFNTREEPYSLCLSDVDRLLDELAAKSMWSNLKDCESRKPPRNARLILQDLYDTLSPRQAAYMTQIILKDLRPLLYPVPGSSTNQSLNDYNSRAYDELNQWSMMKAWHWAMPRIYRAKADFDRAADLVEQIPRDLDMVPDKKAAYSMAEKLSELELGVPVDIPKAVKASGTCLASTISKLKGDVWAEVKLDGERMQIHVDMSKPEKEQIQIFSKSHRDSTGERVNTLIPIRAALGLSLITSCKLIDQNPRPSDKPKIVSGIFEAEMVAWNLTKQHVDEFWRISELKRKPSRSKGHKSTQKVIKFCSDEESGYESEGMDTQQSSDSHRRHLAVVFFDVLSINGQSVINSPYSERQRLLESAVQVIPNYAMLVERRKFTNVNHPASHSALREYYAKIIAERHEGLMLKADQSCYNDYKPGLQWYKVKKDYIKGYGDTADYAILGAGWDRDRARELRVSTATYTAWYVGLCKNLSEVESKGATPEFEIVFKVLSYGLTRANLDKLNQDAQQVGGYPHTAIPSTLPFEYELAQGLSAPDIIFKKPMVFELMGSGFTKRSRWHAYELRWPRVIKAHDPNERDWKTAIDLSEHNQIARRATDPEVLKAENEESETGPDTAYEAEIKAWMERLTRDDDNWNKKRSNKKVSTTTSTKAYIPDWLSDTSDEFSDTSECLADVITVTSPVSPKAHSFTRRPAPLSPDNLLAQTGSTPPTRKASTFSSRSMTSSPECISPTRMPKRKEVEREVPSAIPSRKRMNTDSTSSSRTVKFRLQSDSGQVDDTFATPDRPERQLKSVSTTRPSRFGPLVTKSLALDGIQRMRRSLDATSILSTSAEQRHQVTSENDTPLAERTRSKRSLPDSSPEEDPHRSKRRLTECSTERTRTMYQPIQNDVEDVVSPKLYTSTRSGQKNSNSTRTSPTKDSNSTRTSPTKHSIPTHTSPMKKSNATRLSPTKDSNPPRISPMKNSDASRISPMKGSRFTSVSPNKDLRKPRLVTFSPTLPKSASKSVNNANQLSSVTAPSPPKFGNLSEHETASVSGTSTPTPSQENKKLYVPPAVNLSKYHTLHRPRPSSSPQEAKTNSPAPAAIHRSAFKPSGSTSLPQVPTASSTPTAFGVPKYPKSHLSRPLASPHQAATTSDAQAAIHRTECTTSTVSCPSSLPQVTTTLPVMAANAKLDNSPSEDLAPRRDSLKEDVILPEIGSSNSKIVSAEKPPWLEASEVQWCLVDDHDDYGISGTRHKSISDLIKSSEISSELHSSQPKLNKINYIFVQKPNQEIMERVRKQITWRKILNPNLNFVVYDAKALEKFKDGNQNQWKTYKLFDWNSKESINQI